MLQPKRNWIAAGVVIVIIAAASLVWAWSVKGESYTTKDFKIAVGDDEPTKLDTTVYIPETTPAPAVLLAHGFGGSKQTVATQAKNLAAQGYVVLTYSARGFGTSGGKIHLNSPDYEVSDASQMVDFLATRSEVSLDGMNDPRVAAVGGSYGGALALLLAGHDDRVDAIVPQMTWNSLSDALFPNYGNDSATQGDGVFKRSWAGLFYAGGLGAGLTGHEPGSEDNGEDEQDQQGGGQGQGSEQDPGKDKKPGRDPAAAKEDPSCGRWAEQPCQMYQRVAASGHLDKAAKKLLEASSPQSVLGKIKAPTMLVQGESDTLFDLGQADANASGITHAPVKMAWFSGGHDASGTQGDQDHVNQITQQWLDHYLKGTGKTPGNDFSFTRIGGVNSSRADLATLGMTTAEYPGLGGSGRPVNKKLTAAGGKREQTIASPANGTPAAISSLPSMGQLSTLSSSIATEVPGQLATAQTKAQQGDPADIVGAPQIKLKAASENGKAVLFVKMYDVSPSGQKTLQNGLIAPVRLDNLPSDVSKAKPVTVDLPGVVHRLEVGHKLQVVVATADQSYAGPTEASDYTIDMPDSVRLPMTPAQPLPSTNNAWLVALIALAIVLPLGALTAWLVARLRHRRRDRSVEADLADTPLVVNDLRKVYKDGFVAVDGVSFKVEKGQVVGLLGPNGAGKTTSLRVLMGLLQPSEGDMRVFGHRVTPGAPVLSRLGALVEGPGLLPHLSGMDNLRLFWRATGRPEAEAHFDTVVEIADLGDRIHRKVRTYSHGMKQRIAIAQAMLGLPQLLVLDEPTDGLDPPQIAEMRQVLHHYAQNGRAVLVSSHLLAEVEQTCTHVVVMSRGKVVADGPVADVIGHGSGARLEDAFLELVEQ